LARRGAAVQPWDPPAGSARKPLTPPEGVSARDIVVLHQVLCSRDQPGRDLRRLVSLLPAHTRLALCEPASYGRLGRWLAGHLSGTPGRRVLGTDPAKLASMCLCAGLSSLHQTWPQGLRSLVLITGKVHPVAARLWEG